jgi:hypothetical protein
MDEMEEYMPEATETELCEATLEQPQSYVYSPDTYIEDEELPPPVPDSDDMFSMPAPEEEDALTIFNKQWMASLEEKRAAEYENEKAARAQAAQDHSTWSEQRDFRLNTKKETNRSEEQEKLESVESESENLQTWDRVAKLIDSGVEASELATTSDTSRMHKLFIHLKNEPLEKTRGLAMQAK